MPRVTTIALFALLATCAIAGLPQSGWYVPELSIFDDVMQDVMEAEGVTGGVLAISVDGRIVYQRGFGWLDDPADGRFMPENTPMRIASVEKPLTSAAVRRLVETGFDELEWSDRVFDINGNGGILEYSPWNGLGDSRLQSINVGHCFNHIGGWDRDTATICSDNEGDPMFDDVCIADTMEIPSPPSQHQLIRYMLSEPLQFTPGTLACRDGDGNPRNCYSNFGYMLLGRVVHAVSGYRSLDYIRRHIITTDMWVPRSEVIYGRTFQIDQDPREPTYHDSRLRTNVFDPDGDDVPYAYGAWSQENLLGHGNLVCSAVPLLRFMDFYQVGVGGIAGVPLYGSAPMNGS
ncbi:MAG: serine hydrolase domain-containing protein, partial [Phycisphaerae bacterium]